MPRKKSGISRRSFLGKSTAATAAVGMSSLVKNDDYKAIAQNVNTNSQPSNLKITDMRVACIGSPNFRRYMIRLDTNQGIHGYGEVRDGASKTYALMLKNRIMGMNPCNVDRIFRKIKQFGYHARQAGGVCAVEVACWDLAGKAWGVPCWQMLGGKFRDKILVYAHVSGRSAEERGNDMKANMERGFKFFKTGIGSHVLSAGKGLFNFKEGTVTYPEGMTRVPDSVFHYNSIRLTDRGIKILVDHWSKIRDIVGWEIPIAMGGIDHYGRFGIEENIKLARVLDQFNFAWYEDMMPWQYTDQYVRLKNSCTTPVLTGEDIYLKDGFMDLFEKKAIAICHPDIATSGGLIETKKIGDLAQEHGIAMAMHNGGNPVTTFASVHCAAATENFMALEYPFQASPWYDTLVDGVPKPLVQDGYISVPNSPGLGVELNEEACKKMLGEPGWFEPTPEWDDERSHDRLWSLQPGRKKHINV